MPREDKPSTPQLPKQGPIQKMMTSTIQRRLREATGDISKKRNFVLQRFEDRIFEVLPEYGAEFLSTLAALRGTNYATESEMVEQISSALTQFLEKRISPEELERKIKISFVESKNWVIVNRILAYDLKGDEVILHIPAVFEKNPLTIISLFMKGLRELSDKLQTDPVLADVSTISGTSWIVYKYAERLQSMGFTVSERDDNTQKAFASIDKKKFIELYGNKS